MAKTTTPSCCLPEIQAANAQQVNPGNTEVTAVHLALTTPPAEVGVQEQDVHLRVAEEMCREDAAVVSPNESGESDGYCEVIEYHEGITPITILGQALGKRLPNRLTRVRLKRARTDQGVQLEGVREASTNMEFLEQKGALNIPPRNICNKLLKLYFTCVYPYAPILDRVQFMEDYYAGRHSVFIMQSILANVAAHTSEDILRQIGFKDRETAQKTFYSRATLIYDLGNETGQLSRLQGSIMLSSLLFSYAVDKDFRYWFSNACRIATQLGLHRQYISERIDPRSKRLFRRIWWTLYNRDVLMAVLGLTNLTYFDERYSDAAQLTPDDWEDSEIPERYASVVPPTTRLHKIYLVENCKLSVIRRVPSNSEIKILEDDIMGWKNKLDPEISLMAFQEWSTANVWVLVLLAISFRLEAVFYRALRELHRRSSDYTSMQRVTQRQENAMFELSSIVQRASINNVIGLCPMSFMTCASSILAMRIEIALEPNTTPKKKMALTAQLFTELQYIRESCEYWSSMTWTLRMFEVAISRTGLGIGQPGGGKNTESSGQGDQRPQDQPLFPQMVHHDCVDGLDTLLDPQPAAEMNSMNDFAGVFPLADDYDWLESILAAPGHEDRQL
ncbi:cutinase transcription factor 1 beta [Fusarium sp. NRRL 52700]|nr:cutinase transcription factor 1 beta [Fusarium sp. NRRL 52700]